VPATTAQWSPSATDWPASAEGTVQDGPPVPYGLNSSFYRAVLASWQSFAMHVTRFCNVFFIDTAVIRVCTQSQAVPEPCPRLNSAPRRGALEWRSRRCKAPKLGA
jgi:hypothetical protein